ncbi:flagellar biosynthetic protein FliO [Undibacterium sp. RTI2.1]|uniref:flagellar biosynthetic protein FliO n=1 Tax=unclassified Undibacterium TaxID=2630295 RepID=UPI002AB3A15E|nr:MULTISPECIES: flagellar biosynthetic protein FliO [unclassified Undibacterium]MDY7537115.1 flagellar biosynthetic protein FliO [Undibacterium sp. 5I1]MEB0029846.1 flagellar biosynthetic protein FliO [Undibacterium sp. RTI2.1]MEB0115131.1 flagellar biosynthetic protein FliO [Undibacterium sp. RTI2.2]MEB0229293.1 flagellar biosynthetic protein FliO [Undibacterium sp. 10I3]MEB0256159.1 flagellar biosynthetic protein FliO [Undibacterium sp. 5I1]
MIRSTFHLQRHRYFCGSLCGTFIGLLFVSDQAWASAETKAISPTTGFLQILLGLGAVLALMLFAAWLFKRIGPAVTGNKIPVNIIGGVNVGNRERIMVVEVADQWIVVGVTAQQITTLSTMPKQEQIVAEQLAKQTSTQVANPFSAWLAKTIEKRNNGINGVIGSSSNHKAPE